MPTSVKLLNITRNLEPDYLEGFRNSEGILPKVTTPEEIITFIARVSNPKGQEKQTAQSALSLLRYLYIEGHVSPPEMVNMTVEVQCSRAVSAQLLRHVSLKKQEFSQRYADPDTIAVTDLLTDLIDDFEPRLQDEKNRQNSTAIEDSFLASKAKDIAKAAFSLVVGSYKSLIALGIAKEVARGLLPMDSPTRIILQGNIRDWFFYLAIRNKEGTQKEHREVAAGIEAIFKKEMPAIWTCLQEFRYFEVVKRDLWKMIDKDGDIVEFEVVAKKKDGSMKTISFPLPDELI